MTVSVDDVKDRIAAALKLSAGRSGLEPWWDTVCTSALAMGAHDIDSGLLARGFTQAQLDDWTDRDTHVLAQALYWSLVNSGSLEAFDAKFVEKLDQREGLKTLALTDASGNLASSASVGHGVAKARDDERFVDATTGKFKPW